MLNRLLPQPLRFKEFPQPKITHGFVRFTEKASSDILVVEKSKEIGRTLEEVFKIPF